MAKRMQDLEQRVKLIFENTQANNRVVEMTEKIEKLRAEYEKMKASGKEIPQSFLSKTLKEIETEIEATEQEMGKLIGVIKSTDSVLQEITGQSVRTLATARNQLRQQIRGWSPEFGEEKELEKMVKGFEDATNRINELRAGFNKPLEAAQDTTGMTVNRMEKLIEVLKASQTAVAKNKEKWDEYGEAIKKVNADIERVKGQDAESIRERATGVISQVKDGSYSGTAEQTRENIKLIQEYNAKVNEVGSEPFKEANEVIAKLNLELKAATQNLMSYDEAQAKLSRMNELEDIRIGNKEKGIVPREWTEDEKTEWKELSKEVDRVRKSLELYKSSLKDGDTSELKNVNEELRQTQVYANRAAAEIGDMDEFLKKGFKTANLEQLQIAAKELEQRIAKAGAKTAEFANNASKLRQLDKQIKSLNKSMEYQGNIILRTAQRLTSYVLVYTGFNEVVGYVKQLTQANLDLSDSLADIQKTTGLSVEAVGNLSKEIDAIDTRTAQKELHDLAYEAGKLGISAEQDVLGFVKAGNQLLVALGEDLGGAEAVRSLMKVNAILGETQKLGVEKALLATGSAINEITQTSRASAGPINDIVGRIGAIGAAAQMSMPDLIALAGTADALGQSAEVSGTAFNKFITAVQTNTKEIAVNVGIPEQQLRDLMKAGNTMDAIVLILEKMRAMGGLDVLAPMMASFGSDGERIKQVLTTMVGGVDELKAQLFTANRAFEEATSVTNEYNIKNENAAAIVQRMANSIREAFVNSGIVEVLTDILRMIASIPNVIDRNYQAFRLLASAVAGVVVHLTVMNTKLKETLGAFKLLQWQTYAKPIETFVIAMTTASGRAAYLRASLSNLSAVANSVRSAWLKMVVAIQSIKWKQLGTTILTFGKSLFQLSTYTNLAVKGWKALGAVMSTNFVGFALNALASVITYIALFRDETEKAVKTVDTYDENLHKEQTELDNLRFAIDHANKSNGERAALIKQLNDKYGSYLGFMVTEKNYADEQVYIYDLLNEKLRETIALKMKEKTLDSIVDKYSDLRSEYANAIMEELQGMKNIGDTNKNEAYRTIIQAFNQAIEEDKEYSIDLMQDFKKQYELSGIKFSIGFQENLARLFGVMKNIKKESEQTVKIFSAENEAAGIAQLAKQYENLSQKQEDGIFGSSDLENLKTYKDQSLAFIQSAQNSISALNAKIKNGQELTKGEKKMYDERIAQIDKVNAGLDKVNARYKEIGQQNLYGKGIGIENMSGDQLSSMYKKLNEDYNKLRGDASGKVFESTAQDAKEIAKQMGLNTEYWEVFKDRASALKWYYEQAKAIKAKMKSMGLNTSGSFVFDDEGDGSVSEQRTKARQAYQASVSALKAYFNERETLIRQGNLTEEEMNRQLLATQIEYEQDSQELRRKFIGDKSTFDPSKYKGVLSGYEYFTQKDLDEQAKQYQQFGDYMTDGARNMITKSELKIEELMDKAKENIKKALLEGDMFAGFEDKFSKMLDELGVLTSKAEQELFAEANLANRMNGIDEVVGLSPEIRKQRIAELVRFADESYKVNGDGLKALMLQSTQYSEWVKNLDSDQMNVLLQKLRWYYDERLSLTKRYQDQMNKEFEIAYEQSGDRFKHEQKKLEVSEEGQRLEMMEDLGISVDYKDKLQQTVDEYLAEVAKQKARMDDALSRMDAAAMDMEEAEQNYGTDSDEYRSAEARYLAAQTNMTQIQFDNNKLRADNERQQTQIVLDEWKKRAEKMGEYASLFGDYLGEEVMLSKQANDARARGDLETAKKIEDQRKKNKQALIQNLLNMIIDEAALWAKELALKQMFNALSVQSDKEKATEEVSLTNRKSLVTILLNALTGQSEEHKKGLPGLVTGAIIFAATMALQAFAKSAVASMFPEAASSSGGNRKLSTGMLTYAEGNYPVLGNDGKVYDAKYEGSNLKTGVYKGGAHFGIFSEKQPEMIVDGKTTQKLILNYPHIYDAITTIAKHGRLVNAMPTFAAGDYPAGLARLTGTDASAVAMVDEEAIAREERTNALLEQNTAAFNRFIRMMESGITAHVDGLENYKQQKKNERFLKRRGID